MVVSGEQAEISTSTRGRIRYLLKALRLECKVFMSWLPELENSMLVSFAQGCYHAARGVPPDVVGSFFEASASSSARLMSVSFGAETRIGAPDIAAGEEGEVRDGKGCLSS